MADARDAPSPQALALLEELKAGYRRALPAKLEELRAAVARARAEPSRLEDASDVAHRLAGTAGAYGLDVFGTACAAAHAALQEIRGGIDAWPRLEEALADAEAACLQAAR